MASPTDLCAYCRHARKTHCIGDVTHVWWKQSQRNSEYQDKHHCTTKHCESPLCCCTQFKEPTDDPILPPPPAR